MQYMMMIFQNASEWAKLSTAERNRVHDDCTVWHEELVKSGHARSAAGLQPVTTATTVREKKGRPIVTDGPFAETREVLGGFEIVECKDLDEAMAIAKRFPALRVAAAVEVRPLMTEPCRD
jgi:hypothetical protein